MQQKTYVIRKLAFFYSDEYYFIERQDGIVDTFDDEQEARQELAQLEVPRLRAVDLGNIEHTAAWRKFQDERAALDQYLQSLSLPSVVSRNDETGELFAKLDTFLPQSLTDEQIMHVREITGIRFHELSVFEGEVVFYGIWLPRDNKFLQAEGAEYGGTFVYFFNSYDEALEGIQQRRYSLARNKLTGTIDTLTEQPNVFRSFVKDKWAILYDEQAGIIEINDTIPGDELIAFNALLKVPLFEIRAIPLEDAELFPVWPYELV
jgi:hypothetical protein